MGTMTYFGQEYAIDYYNPDVDPDARKECQPIMGGNATSCMWEAATQFCSRLLPPPNNCVKDMTIHIAAQLNITASKRLDAKCSYKKLGLEMDAPGPELYKKAASVARERKMNMSPFRRVDNGTLAFDTWSEKTIEAGAAIDTFRKIHDPESREWNDKPCTPCKSLYFFLIIVLASLLYLSHYSPFVFEDFGGALCGKYDKDGNMLIEV